MSLSLPCNIPITPTDNADGFKDPTLKKKLAAGRTDVENRRTIKAYVKLTLEIPTVRSINALSITEQTLNFS